MAFSIFTDGVRQAIGGVTFDGSWSGSQSPDAIGWFEWGYTSFANQSGQTGLDTPNGSYSASVSINKDSAAKVRAKGYSQNSSQGSNINFQTYADPASFPSGLTPGTPAPTTCPVSGSIIPNTVQSTCGVNVEYRIVGTVPWLDGGTVASGLSGSGTTALNFTLSALVPGTNYEARFHSSRNTVNAVHGYSAIGTFTTQASTPLILAPGPANATFDSPNPTVVLGGGAVIIDLPAFEADFTALNPSIIISATRVIDLIVTFNTVIEVDFPMS